MDLACTLAGESRVPPIAWLALDVRQNSQDGIRTRKGIARSRQVPVPLGRVEIGPDRGRLRLDSGGRCADRHFGGHFADLENSVDTLHLAALELNIIDHRRLETRD